MTKMVGKYNQPSALDSNEVDIDELTAKIVARIIESEELQHNPRTCNCLGCQLRFDLFQIPVVPMIKIRGEKWIN